MVEGSGLNGVAGHRTIRASDRVVVPLKPGNAVGGKDPDFWCVFEANEGEVIGDEPANTRCDPDFAEETLRQACPLRRRAKAGASLAWTDRTMTRLGLTLNRTKTRLCEARTERFDFLGYSFGLHRIRQDGRRYIGASPSAKSVQRLKDRVSAILVPGNMGRWDDVRAQLTRLMRGWSGYFSPGSHYVTDRVIEAHIYDRVRNFLVRRHKMPARSIGPFTMEAVFGTLGVPRLRHCRQEGVLS